MASYKARARSSPISEARRVLTLPRSGTRANTRRRSGEFFSVLNFMAFSRRGARRAPTTGSTIYDLASMPPVVALLTDFGTRDPYVAAMKSVIASRCDATILDLTHEIPPFDVFEAAFVLAGIAEYLQRKQFIVVAVVDPGVGTERRLLAMERKGQIFLAPDNGLLTLLEGGEVRSVENASLFLPDSSNTFHGRDRFAPVAAALANGTSFSELGPSVPPAEIVKLDYQRPR